MNWNLQLHENERFGRQNRRKDDVFARHKITPCIFAPTGEGSGMTPMQQSVSNTVGANSVVHLLVTDGKTAVMAQDPEQVMEEMWQRATQVGSVLEDILQEPRGISRWGLNE